MNILEIKGIFSTIDNSKKFVSIRINDDDVMDACREFAEIHSLHKFPKLHKDKYYVTVNLRDPVGKEVKKDDVATFTLYYHPDLKKVYLYKYEIEDFFKFI